MPNITTNHAITYTNSGIDVANIMIEIIRTCTMNHIEHNIKFRHCYDIINGDPDQLVKKVN